MISRLMPGLAIIALIFAVRFEQQTNNSPVFFEPPSSGLDERPLKSIAPPHLKVGGALHAYDDFLWNSEEYLGIAEREFNAITGTVYMAYGAWTDERRTPRFKSFERAVDWATSRNMKFHGHALLYPAVNKNLEWWMNLKDQQIESHLQQYVSRLVGCRKGKVWVWDVVNEVMADDGNPMDKNGLRTEYKEYRSMGPEYVEKVFRWAHQADENAILILNDYGLEPISPKSDRLLAYAMALKRKGVPIHGIGFQMHIFDLDQEPDYDSIQANFQRFADAGFKLYITEMDVMAARKDPPTPGVRPAPPTAAELQRQKRIYQNIAKIAMEQPACESLLLWDFVDNYSWLHPSIIESPSIVNLGQYGFPTPYSGGKDEPIAAKPAYSGLQLGLEGIESDELDYRSFRISNLVETEDSGLLVKFNTVRLDTFESTDIESASWRLEPVEGMPQHFRLRCDLAGEARYLSRSAVLINGNWEPDSGVYLDSLNESWYSQRWKVTKADEGTWSIQSAWEPTTGFLKRIVEGADPEPKLAPASEGSEPAAKWILQAD